MTRSIVGLARLANETFVHCDEEYCDGLVSFGWPGPGDAGGIRSREPEIHNMPTQVRSRCSGRKIHYM